ncbi:MAG: serine/threonine protein kinase [Gemmataceae bacterium]|nr:serine/threonine protein kinase [Gemmataceae bacterium]
MSVAVADQNLLFGLLALQMDFISRDALVAAFAGWMVKKEESLGAIMVAQGGLDRHHHDLLTALVEAHLNKHGGDADKSLAALSPLGSVRADLQKIADPALQASLVRVAQATHAADVRTVAPTMCPPTLGPPASSGSRFRFLRELAKGGLGRIDVARDGELNREVALKEIQERHADNLDSRERFVREARVTGQLEHPGVVPVYSLGQYQDGRPYYAMRLIRGDSLKEAIRRFHGADPAKRDPGHHALELHGLLSRFVVVCQAMQYAHDRGILHRDLKPANIMLGKYGETLVVDWGLAKEVDKPESAVTSDEPTLRPSTGSGSAETLPGSAMGTPQYMSPEQAAGRLDQLGPASDVYSLGATLFCLLTGRPPFDDADVGTIIQRVQRGDFLPPRRVNPEVSPALEAICLKAMALRPQDRYASPRLLAEDVEAWMADEPVSAWPEPWTQRLMRWARRHRMWAEAAALTLVIAAVAATLISLWMRQRAEQEREARVIAEELRKKGIRTAAQFAARTIAYEIDLRWWILKGAADDAELRQLVRTLAKVNKPLTDPTWQTLQSWTKERFDDSARARATSWFVTDHEGRHLARHPSDEDLVGKSFAFRDYFHGLGRDLPEGVRKDPIRDVHRSVVFVSQATGNRMVTFSVPIWSGAQRESAVLGVLGMTVELGQFAGLRVGDHDAEKDDRFAVLLDTKEDQLEGSPQRGLILQHPWFEELRSKQSGKLPMLRLAPQQLKRLEELRKARLHPETPANGNDVDTNYQDPAGGDYAGRWLAAFEPVIIQGRTEKTKDTGWAVIVQER